MGTVEINQEDEVIMILLSITLLVVLLLNVLYVIREKHLRSDAAEISNREIEQMMLVRKLCIGDLCMINFTSECWQRNMPGTLALNGGQFFSLPKELNGKL